MKTYTATIDGYELLVCEVNSKSVEKAISDFEGVDRQQLDGFVSEHFGEEGDFGEYYAPDLYICTTKKVAEKLTGFLKGLEFVDRFMKRYCEVEQQGKFVRVCRGEW